MFPRKTAFQFHVGRGSYARISSPRKRISPGFRLSLRRLSVPPKLAAPSVHIPLQMLSATSLPSAGMVTSGHNSFRLTTLPLQIPPPWMLFLLDTFR